MKTYNLTLSCRNRKGIVAAVAGQIAHFDGNIVEAQQFDDPSTGNFFMRVAFQAIREIRDFEQAFAPVVRQFDLTYSLNAADRRPKVLVLVSRFDHCLADLIYLMRLGELKMDCVGIVSNHPKSALKLTLGNEIPFHYLPVTPETKSQQEAKIKDLIEVTGAELVVLARYMQILSDRFSNYLYGRAINIHHSFLPGFKGAKPYHQAFERGVKIIGATAHYVTADLDEGPIIAQDVELVTHKDTPEDLVRKGRDIERRVLARALSLHLENRILLNGAKTVVFS